MAENENLKDPYPAFRFKVKVTGGAGIIHGAFSDVSGLNFEVTYAEYATGEDPYNQSRRIPIKAKSGDITLKRGYIGELGLMDWLGRVRAGQPGTRATVTITLVAPDGPEISTWKLINARPSKWTGPTFGAKSTDVAMEELVLVSEHLEWKAGGP